MAKVVLKLIAFVSSSVLNASHSASAAGTATFSVASNGTSSYAVGGTLYFLSQRYRSKPQVV
jgi:hypothetical protein